MSVNVGEVKGGEAETGKVAHMYFVGGNSGGSIDGLYIGVLDVWGFYVPLDFLFVADHTENSRYRAIVTLDTAVGAGMIGACGDLVDAKALEERAGEFGAQV